MVSRHRAGLLLVLLLASGVVTLLSVPPVLGSTGRPTLGVADTDATQPTTFTAGTAYVNVTAGSDAARTDGPVSGYFSICFGTFHGAQLVNFSGSQFSLYLSRDGLAQISPGDISYAGPTLFFVSDLTTNAGWHSVTEANGTFYIGQTTSGKEVVTGPIPLSIPNTFKYVKVYDGSTTAVSVSTQYIRIGPGLKLTPTSGSAGTEVTVMGGGFSPSASVDLAYSYTFYPWSGTATRNAGNWATGVNTGSGYFSSTAPMLDTKQAYNPKSGLQPMSSINITAVYHANPQRLLATATFRENTRVFTEVKSYSPTRGVLGIVNAPPGPYGNDSSTAGSNIVQPIEADVSAMIVIAGNHMLVNSALAFWVGNVQFGSASTNGTGYFNATITVPVLPAGTDFLKVINDGVTYEFEIQIYPTLVLSPSSGPVGASVAVKAYGFPTNTKWFLYWQGLSFGDETWYQVAHGTVDGSGTFNVTVVFEIPLSNGGSHYVAASSTNATRLSTDAITGTMEAYATSVVTSSTTTTTSTTTSTSTTSTTSTTPKSSTTSSTTSSTSTSTTTTMASTTSTTVSTSSTTSTGSSSTSATSATSSATTTATHTSTPTQSTTSTTTSLSKTTTTAASSGSPYAYVALGAIAVVLVVGVLWALRSRRD